MDVRSYGIISVSEFEQNLKKELNDGYKPTLAICFSAATFDFKALSSFLTGLNIDTIGTSTCGEIHNGTCTEDSCSILLMDIDRNAYQLQLENFDEGEDAAARQVAQIAVQKFSNPALLTYASKIGVNGDKIVRGFKEILDPHVPIFGGLAGDNFINEKFTVFCNDTMESNGLATLIFDGDKIKVEGTAFSGWEALGKTHTVTKVEGNVLYEVDHKPALDLFISYFGLENSNSPDQNAMEVIPGIYPIKVMEENEMEVMRSPLLYDRKNHALILAGEVQLGDKVKYCPMPDIDTVNKTVEYMKDYAESTRNIDAIIVNSCAGRKYAFGPLMNKETKEIYELWNVPTAGFMAMGEIGSSAKESECKFHNVTCSLLSLTEIK